jgi:hypothetical protein
MTGLNNYTEGNYQFKYYCDWYNRRILIFQYTNWGFTGIELVAHWKVKLK